jgi:hypothetical protein
MPFFKKKNYAQNLNLNKNFQTIVLLAFYVRFKEISSNNCQKYIRFLLFFGRTRKPFNLNKRDGHSIKTIFIF